MSHSFRERDALVRRGNGVKVSHQFFRTYFADTGLSRNFVDKIERVARSPLQQRSREGARGLPKSLTSLHVSAQDRFGEGAGKTPFSNDSPFPALTENVRRKEAFPRGAGGDAASLDFRVRATNALVPFSARASIVQCMVGRMKLSWSFARGLHLGTTLAFFVCAAPIAAAANDREVFIDMDYARIVRIPEGAQTLVIGNPQVADVTMLKNSPLMVITGKNFGTTNLVILDRVGAQVGESIITVVPARDKLIVHRGLHRESYSCRPNCMPAGELGDDPAFLSQVIESVKLHDSALASGKR